MQRRTGLAALPSDGSTLSNYTPTMRERMTDALRRMMFSDDRAGQEKAERVSNVLDFTPVGVATGMYDAGRDLGGGNYAGAAINLGMAGLPGPPVKGIRAFHGSPHSFDKFSMDKIGTGEGAQAYGHGLYFAESEGVAKSYRDALSQASLEIDGKPYQFGLDAADAIDSMDGLTDKAKESLRWHINRGYSFDEALKDVRSSGNPADAASLDQALASKRLVQGKPGSMYEVNINADPESFLDWDKPLPLSHPFRSKLDEFGSVAASASHPHEANIGRAAVEAARNANATGADLYQKWGGVIDSNRANLRSKYGQKADDLPAEELGRMEAGIPGIKYLDAGSRGKGDGSRNYVVFDDKLIDIVRKYGIAGASAMAGYNILDGMDEAQAAELNRIEAAR